MICPKRWEGRVCKYNIMHERAIHCVLPQGRTVQKDGSNRPNPPANHTMPTHFLGEFPGLGLALVPDVVVKEAK